MLVEHRGRRLPVDAAARAQSVLVEAEAGLWFQRGRHQRLLPNRERTKTSRPWCGRSASLLLAENQVYLSSVSKAPASSSTSASCRAVRSRRKRPIDAACASRSASASGAAGASRNAPRPAAGPTGAVAIASYPPSCGVAPEERIADTYARQTHAARRASLASRNSSTRSGSTQKRAW